MDRNQQLALVDMVIFLVPYGAGNLCSQLSSWILLKADCQLHGVSQVRLTQSASLSFSQST